MSAMFYIIYETQVYIIFCFRSRTLTLLHLHVEWTLMITITLFKLCSVQNYLSMYPFVSLFCHSPYRYPQCTCTSHFTIYISYIYEAGVHLHIIKTWNFPFHLCIKVTNQIKICGLGVGANVRMNETVDVDVVATTYYCQWTEPDNVDIGCAAQMN